MVEEAGVKVEEAGVMVEEVGVKAEAEVEEAPWRWRSLQVTLWLQQPP